MTAGGRSRNVVTRRVAPGLPAVATRATRTSIGQTGLVMATLVVIGYADQGVAEDARQSIQDLEDELSIQSDHVASIARDVEGRYHAHISHSGVSAGEAIDWGSFWGALFGLLFFIPVAGVALGPGAGVLRDHLGGKGIDEGFRDEVRAQVKPGTSAVFVMTERTAPDKAVGAVARYGGTMIKTSLSTAQFERLREALRSPTPVDTSPRASNQSG